MDGVVVVPRGMQMRLSLWWIGSAEDGVSSLEILRRRLESMSLRRKLALTVFAISWRARGVCLEVEGPAGILNKRRALAMPLRLL